MSTEFSLDGFTKYCGLKWSKPRLAKNRNKYRKAEPTEAFWEWYNGEEDNPDYRIKQKAFLKEHNIGIYKEYGKFGLFDWNFPDKGTEEEYEQQEKEQDALIRERLYPRLLEQIYKGTPRECTLNKRELDRCKTAEQMIEFAIHEIVNGISICDIVNYELSLE